MARPSEQQVRQMEMAHKGQFVDLVLANKLFLSLLPRLHGKTKTSKEYLAITEFGKAIARNAAKWYMRQRNFETKAKVPIVSNDILKWFMMPGHQVDLVAEAKKYVAPQKYDKTSAALGCITIHGMGFIPLLIWAVIAIVVAFTAYEITDELNTTAEEKADLLKQTEKTLKDLNVTGPQAAAIIQSTQEQASEGSGGGMFGGFGKLLMWGAIAYGVNEFFIKPKRNAAASK